MSLSTRLVVVFGFLSALGTASSAQRTEPYAPQLNQPGKDVQWVPTPPLLAERMEVIQPPSHYSDVNA